MMASLLLAAAVTLTGPSEALWRATVQVESGGNAKAYNKRSHARGVVQICPAVLKELRRAYPNATLYSAKDCYNPNLSRQIWKLYLWVVAPTATTDRDYALVWRYGPTGAKRGDPKGYWAKIKKQSFGCFDQGANP